MEILTNTFLRISLFEPDIPQNTGSILRLAACFGIGVDIIEPCGFLISDRRLKRVGLDYVEQADIVSYQSWDVFFSSRIDTNVRLLLLTTKAEEAYTSFNFKAGDTLLLGRESAGVPENVHQAVDARITIPLAQGMRSLNVAQSASMVLGEALRQMEAFPSITLKK